MRFFSNDARESTDEQAQDERPERVQSEPVAVPNQRPPSPWSNTPATDDPAAADTDRREGGADTGREGTDAPPFHEPGPQPTAFGASTVGGAVAASATANPANDRAVATDRDTAADSGVGDDASVAPGDGVVTSSTNTYAGSTAGAAPDTVPEAWTERGGRDDRNDPDGAVDLPLDDKTGSAAPPAGAVSARSGALDTDRDPGTTETDKATRVDDPVTAKSGVLKDEGGFDDPKAVDPATDQPLDGSAGDGDRRTGPDAATTTDAGTKTDAGPLKDDGGFDDPKVVDPVTDRPLDADRTPADSPSDSTPPAAVPAAAAAPAAKPDTLFDQEEARAFQERWRDVQLRFVDSPKDAAADAAGLVDEAVEKLTASLRSQREGLTDDTEDTERLRVQLRGYRDILNRVLSL